MSDDLYLLPELLCGNNTDRRVINKNVKEILISFLVDSLTKMGIICTGKPLVRINSYYAGAGSTQISITLSIPIQINTSRSTSISIYINIIKDKDGKFKCEDNYRELCYIYPRNQSTHKIEMAGKEVGYDILRAFDIYNFDGLYKAPEF